MSPFTGHRNRLYVLNKFLSFLSGRTSKATQAGHANYSLAKARFFSFFSCLRDFHAGEFTSGSVNWTMVFFCQFSARSWKCTTFRCGETRIPGSFCSCSDDCLQQKDCCVNYNSVCKGKSEVKGDSDWNCENNCEITGWAHTGWADIKVEASVSQQEKPYSDLLENVDVARWSFWYFCLEKRWFLGGNVNNVCHSQGRQNVLNIAAADPVWGLGGFFSFLLFIQK